MKRFFPTACALALAACLPAEQAQDVPPAAANAASAAASADTLAVPTVRGEIVVPRQPERVAVYDWAALDALNQLGVNVDATTAPMQIDYL